MAIALLFSLLGAGCAPSTIPYQTYLDKNANSIYDSDFVQHENNNTIGFLGFHTSGNEQLRDSNRKDVKLDGLILDARSVLVKTEDRRAVFGNEKDSCIILFTTTVKRVRRGRSALTSIMNLSSSLKGKHIDRQHDPDTSLRSVESAGIINLQGKPASFYFIRSWDKKADNYGRLFLEGDTIIAKHIAAPWREAGNWVELLKNDSTYAAINLSNTSSAKVYILRTLSETDKLLIASYFSILIYNRKIY